MADFLLVRGLIELSVDTIAGNYCSSYDSSDFFPATLYGPLILIVIFVGMPATRLIELACGPPLGHPLQTFAAASICSSFPYALLFCPR